MEPEKAPRLVQPTGQVRHLIALWRPSPGPLIGPTAWGQCGFSLAEKIPPPRLAQSKAPPRQASSAPLLESKRFHGSASLPCSAQKQGRAAYARASTVRRTRRTSGAVRGQVSEKSAFFPLAWFMPASSVGQRRTGGASSCFQKP